jgi:hypothetical protein
MARVLLPSALVAIVAGLPRQTEIAGDSVGDLIAALDARWPGVATSLCVSSTALRPHIAVYVDGLRATLATPATPGAVVRVLTAVSGG